MKVDRDWLFFAYHALEEIAYFEERACPICGLPGHSHPHRAWCIRTLARRRIERMRADLELMLAGERRGDDLLNAVRAICSAGG